MEGENFYPRNIEEIVERVVGFTDLQKDGSYTELMKARGVSELWIEKMQEEPLCFGFAEQMNPLPTWYARSLKGAVSPEAFHRHVEFLDNLKSALEIENIRSSINLLTLRHCSFTQSGPTASLFFNLGADDQKDRLRIMTNTEAEAMKGMAFSEVEISRNNISRMIQQICDEPFRRGFAQRNQLTFKKGVKGGGADFLCLDRFVQDLNFTLDKFDGQNINYFDFIKEYNKLFLSYFSKDKNIDVKSLDEGTLDKFLVEGVNDWQLFLNSMSTNQAFNPEEDPLFKILMRDDKTGQMRYRVVKVANEAITNKFINEKNFKLNVLPGVKTDTGVIETRIEDLMAHVCDRKSEVPVLQPMKDIEYFVLLSFLSKVMMGDDGVYNYQMRRQGRFLQEISLLKPLIYTYNLENSILTDYKDNRYGFNQECSVNNFYSYIDSNSLKRQSDLKAVKDYTESSSSFSGHI